MDTGSSAGGCASFGLESGDLVTGVLTIDSALVAPGSTTNILEHPGTDLQLTFGDVALDLASIRFTSFFDVTFNADATELTCFASDVAGNCPDDAGGIFLVEGSAEVGVTNTRVSAFKERVFKEAFASDGWTRRQIPPIPEPTGAVLFGLGAVCIAQRLRSWTAPSQKRMTK